MNSEFCNVELDRIRYSLVWEDFKTLSQGLNYKEVDSLLIITSAGCNVLNSILLPVLKVTAIDINPIQNALLKLKLHVIQNHEYKTFSSLLGLQGINAVQQSWSDVRITLHPPDREFWDSYFIEQPLGLLLTGKLERYVATFLSSLQVNIQNKIKKLVSFTNITEQFSYFLNEIDDTSFYNDFTTYFNEVNLSKGRDSKLFKYAEEQSGETFYKRLKHQLKTTLVKENFYFRFFFFGISEIHDILPACYQEKNYTALKDNIHKIDIVNGEAIEYLLSDTGRTISKASLSNIFEYTTHEEFHSVCRNLERFNPLLTIVYWNLLQEQSFKENPAITQTALLASKESCFYFKNANLIKFVN